MSKKAVVESPEYKRGRAEERAAIVEWLRNNNSIHHRMVALRIEATEHLRECEFSGLGLVSGKE